MTTQIKRKAVPSSSPFIPNASESGAAAGSNWPSADANVLDLKSTGDENPGIALGEDESQPDFDEQLQGLQLERGGVLHLSDGLNTEKPSPLQQSEAQAARTSKFKAALNEAKYHAGGIISRPFEATKHYSILRHSHGLVYYKGPTTNVAITVFSDQQLPAHRSLWLQKRGFSGKTGQRIGTLGSRSAWIDVTPGIEATADSLPKDDERAWQRDIAKFLKKAKDAKRICSHRPYETDVVRIPHGAEDGYFRIVLCAGRKVLCPSPGFRYASLSLDPSILRGASLRTLPLEVGIRIGSMIAHTTANTAASGALQPTLNTVKTITQPYQLDDVTQWAATKAYDASGAGDKINGTIGSVDEQYHAKRELNNISAVGEANEILEMIDAEAGPSDPYPICFSGKAAVRSSNDLKQFGVTIVNLVNVSQDTLLRLAGVYMAWVSISPPKGSNNSPVLNDTYGIWLQAVVTVVADAQKEARLVQRKSIYVHILQSFEEAASFKAKLSLMLMAFLRPADVTLRTDTPTVNHPYDKIADDIAITKLSLSRLSWEPETVLERVKTASSSRSLLERMADARLSGQKQLDKIPVHRLGVRTDSMKWRDDLVGTGGLCIKR